MGEGVGFRIGLSLCAPSCFCAFTTSRWGVAGGGWRGGGLGTRFTVNLTPKHEALSPKP